jgi:hypothetical protein
LSIREERDTGRKREKREKVSGTFFLGGGKGVRTLFLGKKGGKKGKKVTLYESPSVHRTWEKTAPWSLTH